jgi:hypothetical protein
MGITGTDPDHEERVFSESLQRLKRQGCNLLLVGSVPGRTRLAAIRRLLGDDALHRRRIVALTDETPDRIGRVLDPVDTRILVHASASGVREAVTATPSASRSQRVREVGSGLDTLEGAISEEIDRIERGDSLNPGELRVSVDSLRPLVGGHHVESVGEFVESVGDRVRAADGMAHHVLPVPYESAVVQSSTRHVDATVELRTGRSGPEQRWHLPEADLTTSWIEF